MANQIKIPSDSDDQDDQIDRDSSEPAYIQLANILRRQISEGIYRPGDQLPSESQLGRRYGISPLTIRNSLKLLADQGLINTAQGRGSFVKILEISDANFGLSELKDLFADGASGNIKLLDVRVVYADERIAHKLKVEQDAPVIYIQRLLTRQRKPVFYHRGYLIYDPARPILEAEIDVTSLQGLFANAENAMLKRGRLSIEATMLNEEEAKLLQTPYPSAAFLLEHLFYDFQDRPLSWGWFLFRNDILRFTANVGIEV